MSAPAIVISATFAADALEPVLAFWMRELQFNDRIQLAPYNQVFQLLLDPSGPLAANREGINVLLIRLADWPNPDTDRVHFSHALRQAVQASPVPWIVCLCPDPLHAAAGTTLAADLADLPAVHIIEPPEIASLYPVLHPYDPLAEKLGHVPYTPAYFAALGTIVARKIHALRTPPFKVIALDCDDTLWRGICGEDGPQGVVIDPPRRALQEFLLAQQSAGMLLCLCSKNNVEDVLDTFRLHAEMPLRLDHFAAWRINWSPKPANLAALAEELELGLDSFILLDDNPKECREMEAAHPAVLSLALPSAPEDIPEFLRHVWAFDHVRITGEDRARAELYAHERDRQQAAQQAGTLADFLQSLQLEVLIAPMQSKDLARVSQLSQRTNQMNFTTVRRLESDLQALLQSGKAECFTVHVSDRFGSYGLSGAMIFRTSADALLIDTFLLSCRALGRGVEHRMLAELGAIASERGLNKVEAPFVRSARNQPALLFLESVGLQFQSVHGDSLAFRFPAGFAAALRYEPPAGEWKAAASVPPRAATSRAPVPYTRIATELRTPQSIVDRASVRLQPLAVGSRPFEPPRTDLERRLCAIWSDMLHVPAPGIADNFFDLGGHSLLAVQLLSRLRDELGIELSLEVVYGADFTIAELARAIELREIEIAGADQYAALLAEVESLTDEEVRELLAQESGDAP